MKKACHIHLLTTGGTIAGKGQVGKTSGYQAGSLSTDRLLETLPPLPPAHSSIHGADLQH